jgi:uncharacterized membrane protein YdjX (TVP38/TMEM64 family)
MITQLKFLSKLITLTGLFCLGAGLLWFLWEPLITLLSNRAALEAWVEELGIWGPLALVLLGVIQVLVAPLPGYPIIFVSAILYGGFWGAIYANLGILVAGLTAMSLARFFGRPLIERFFEQTDLERIERVLDNDSAWFWFIILFLPTGDLPYFAAGLSRISVRNYLIALSAARLPFTFVLTYAAAHAVSLPAETLLLLAIPVLLLFGLAYWQQQRISSSLHRWIENWR